MHCKLNEKLWETNSLIKQRLNLAKLNLCIEFRVYFFKSCCSWKKWLQSKEYNMRWTSVPILNVLSQFGLGKADKIQKNTSIWIITLIPKSLYNLFPLQLNLNLDILYRLWKKNEKTFDGWWKPIFQNIWKMKTHAKKRWKIAFLGVSLTKYLCPS